MSFYRIGTAARLSGLPVATLRNWEQRYGLVTARRTPGGQRLYSADDIERLVVLKKLVDQGLSAGEAHNLVRARPQIRPPVVESGRVRENARRIRREVAESHARAAEAYEREYEEILALLEDATGAPAEFLRRRAGVVKSAAERRRKLAEPREAL
jgi:DNA-binding transcriptional MerR regulator